MTGATGESHGTESGVYLVGDLRVDVGLQRVARGDDEITLPNLSFQLLLALIRAAPNFVSHDSLMARVWPGLVVSPETLAKRVNLLREALGDSAQEPRYIAGLRSRGYRLLATVSPVVAQAPVPVSQSALPPTSDAAVIEQENSSKPSRKWWLGLAMLAAAAGAIAIGVHAINKTHDASDQHSNESALRAPSGINAPARTVAVLPFENLSADASDAYLALGFPEMILNRLSRIDGISVIARNSSFALTTRNIDSHEIGRRLNSGYLVSGSVQREADRLRVAVQLVDATAGTLVWSAHFDRGLHDIFNVEDEVAEQLAGALSPRLGELEPKPPAGGARSANVEAYLAFIRGRSLLGRFTVAESEAAVPYFEKAIALDPNFAAAYASLYDARMQSADGRREDMKQARERNIHLVNRALELDPQLGAAYFARGMWAEVPHDASATENNPLMAARERDYHRGAELDPSNGRGLWAYASFLFNYMTSEREEEGRSVLARALWVDPMSPRVHFADAEFSFFESNVRVYERKTQQVLELDPDFLPAVQAYAMVRWIADGKLSESIRTIEHAIALDPGNAWSRYLALAIYLDLGDVNAARAVVADLPPNARAAGLLAMHEGDWRRAGLAVYDESGWSSNDFVEIACDFWQGAALRDYALRTGDVSRAIAFIRKHYYFGDDAVPHVDLCSNGAAFYGSQLLAAAGHADQAMAWRRAASAWNDTYEAKYLGNTRRLRAEIFLIEGKTDAALTELAQSFRSGYYQYWWYTLNYDPTWLPLHDDSRFKAIQADVRKYVDGERAQLEALRKQGVVPRRGATTAAH